MARRGRPLEKKPTGKLVSIPEAIDLVTKTLNREKPIYTVQSIYNKIYKGELTRYGPFHLALLDSDEVLKKLCA